MAEPLAFNDSWAMANGELDGFPLVLRFRDHLQPIVGHTKLPNRLQVIWVYDSQPVSGMPAMPSEQLSTSMVALEDALVAGLEEKGLAVLTSVATNRGRREWTWYCGERTEVQNAINDALANVEPYPIQLRISPDPAWSTYTELLRDVGHDAA